VDGSADDTGNEPAVEVAVVALAILSLKDAAPTKPSVITAEVIGLMTGGRDDPNPDKNTESVSVDVVPDTPTGGG